MAEYAPIEESVNHVYIKDWFKRDKNYYRYAPVEELYFVMGYCVSTINAGVFSKDTRHMADSVYNKALKELRKRYDDEASRARNKSRLHDYVG